MSGSGGIKSTDAKIERVQRMSERNEEEKKNVKTQGVQGTKQKIEQRVGKSRWQIVSFA